MRSLLIPFAQRSRCYQMLLGMPLPPAAASSPLDPAPSGFPTSSIACSLWPLRVQLLLPGTLSPRLLCHLFILQLSAKHLFLKAGDSAALGPAQRTLCIPNTALSSFPSEHITRSVVIHSLMDSLINISLSFSTGSSRGAGAV